MNHVVSPSLNARDPGFQMKPSPKHVTVTAFKVGTEGYKHALTSIDGDSFFANKHTSFKSMRFFVKLGFELPRHRVGDFVLAKYTYASSDSWWMVSSTVQGNLRIVRGIADTGAYGAIMFTCKNKLISQEAALSTTAHVSVQGRYKVRGLQRERLQVKREKGEGPCLSLSLSLKTGQDKSQSKKKAER